MNLTLSIDAELLKEARKAALEDDTTVNALVREYLQGLVEGKRRKDEAFLDEWRRLMDGNPVDTGAHSWTRDELHER
jgi:hypothetical protein